jgi:hypothetical protein
MNKSYSEHIENLKKRRLDQEIQQAVVSESFYDESIPEVARYVLESMQEIDASYNYKLFSSFKRTQDLITQKLKALEIPVQIRYQGPHNTDTHVELFGELELLVILQETNKKASSEVENLGNTLSGILAEAQAYNKIDYSDRNKIYIQTRSPQTEVAITPAIWINSSLYNNTKLEINRGICEYNFSKRTRKIYLPFLNMARLNARDRKLSGCLKSMIRLVRSLIHDCPENISLTFDEVVGILYNIPIKELAVPQENYLSVLPNVSLQLQRLIKDQGYREKLLSPGRSEYVFGKKNKVADLKILKKDLDELITDLNDSLSDVNKTLMSPFQYNQVEAVK